MKRRSYMAIAMRLRAQKGGTMKDRRAPRGNPRSEAKRTVQRDAAT